MIRCVLINRCARVWVVWSITKRQSVLTMQFISRCRPRTATDGLQSALPRTARDRPCPGPDFTVDRAHSWDDRRMRRPTGRCHIDSTVCWRGSMINSVKSRPVLLTFYQRTSYWRNYCLSNALLSSIGQNIKSHQCPVSGIRCPFSGQSVKNFKWP